MAADADGRPRLFSVAFGPARLHFAFGVMSKQSKRRLLFFGVLGVGIAAPLAYLFTLGHCYLPLGAFDYRSEAIEVREYDGLYWRAYRETTSWTRAREAILAARDKIVYPGRVRMDAAIAEVDSSGLASPFEQSGQNSHLQKTLEAMGYGFPPGCRAGVETNYVYRIMHCPSMLNRIEKDLSLKRRRDASPNEPLQATAATRPS